MPDMTRRTIERCGRPAGRLGSSCRAALIGYEEFHPYGSTAWRSADGDAEVSAKRYRYTGMEKDEETGLSRHGVRMYATWLGRWTSTDPTGMADGPNRYAYVGGNPVNADDPSGLSEENQLDPDLDLDSDIAVDADVDSPVVPTVQQILVPLAIFDATTGADSSMIRQRYEATGIEILAADPDKKGAIYVDWYSGVQEGPTQLVNETGTIAQVIVHEGVHSIIAQDGGHLRELAEQLADLEYGGDLEKASEALAYYVEERAQALLSATLQAERLSTQLQVDPTPAAIAATGVALDSIQALYERDRDVLGRALADGVEFESAKPVGDLPVFGEVARRTLGHSLEFEDLPAVRELNRQLQYAALGMP